MAVNPTYPGVYIQEIPSGARTIAALPTSVTAFVGRFARGPENAPVRVFNPGDFQRAFGGLSQTREATYAVAQFFQNGGGDALIVRVAPGAETASVSMQDADGDTVLTAFAGQMIGDASVENPGAWGNNLRIDVDYDTEDPAAEFNMVVSEIDVQDGREVLVQAETFRNLSTVLTAINGVVAVVNNGARLIQLTAGALDADDNLVGRPVPTGTAGETGANPSAAIQNDSTLTVTVTTGTGGGAVDVSSALDILAADMPQTLAEARALLEARIRAARPTEPMWAQATVALVGGRLRVRLGRTGADYDPEARVAFADTAGDLGANIGLIGADVTANVQQYRVGTAEAAVAFQVPGDIGVDDAIDPADLPATAAALAGERGARTGIFALEDADVFNILSIPEAALLDAPGAITSLTQIMAPAITYCEERFAMVLIDPAPSVVTLDQQLGWVEDLATAGLRHRNAAAYAPRIRIADPLANNMLRSIAPSGSVAGIYARTDGDFGVFRAPAGIIATVRGIADLDYRLTDPENGLTNPLALNAIRVFDNVGTVLWGARTLRGHNTGNADWRYVPVRRTALNIEGSLLRGLQFTVFAPNDERLWSEVRLAVTGFMSRLFRQGAFQGTNPRDAFFVKCDAENNPQTDIDLGILNVAVGFAALKPAEFVVLSLQLQNLQAQA